MARVVPSDVVAVADRMFPDMVKAPKSFPAVGPDHVPRLIALARLVDAVSPELLTLEPSRYAGVLASVAYLRALTGAFQARREAISLNLVAYEENPVALIREAMAMCPDQAPSAETTALSFIGDHDFRENVRLDICSANADLAEGEWKGAMVLAGSVVEALLLWAIQQHVLQHPGDIAAVIQALEGPQGWSRPSSLNPETWGLQEYIPVAAHIRLIKPETVVHTTQARTFRNLIHPGRSARLGQKCDRATALAALAAVEFVVRDLTQASSTSNGPR